MPPPEQQQQQGVAMPEVNTSLIVADDYVYEVTPPKDRKGLGKQDTQQGGMASQFEVVSSALDRNL